MGKEKFSEKVFDFYTRYLKSKLQGIIIMYVPTDHT